METLKNFAIGLLITVLIFVVLGLGILLWPLLLGIGSLIFFLAVITIAIILVFYVIVFIGYVVRKALKK